MTHLNFPKEEREGIFSSLPLTFFSPSVPTSIIRIFTSNGGHTLPRLDAMELQYYLKSPFNEDHPFYHVDLIFISGSEDLLGTVLRERVLIHYECRWVERCVESGQLSDMGQYVVDLPISEAPKASEGGQESNQLVSQAPTITYDTHTYSSTINPCLSILYRELHHPEVTYSSNTPYAPYPLRHLPQNQRYETLPSNP